MEFKVDLPEENRNDFDVEVNDNEYIIKSGTSYKEKEGYFIFVYADKKTDELAWVYERVLESGTYTYIESI